MNGMLLLAVVAALSVSAYVLAFHGSGFTFATLNDSVRRKKDARRGAELLAEIGRLLKNHSRAISEFLGSFGQANDPKSGAAASASLQRFTQDQLQAGMTLNEQFSELEQLLGRHGDTLFDSERQSIKHYQSRNQEMETLLHRVADGSLDEASGDICSLAQQMLRENDTLRTRVRRCEQQIGGLLSDLERLRQEVQTDSLTLLPNRHAWSEWGDNLEPGQCMVVGMADIDNFKAINDTHGHHAGDGVLCLVGTILRKTRDVNAFRVSGDEFSIVFSERHWKRAAYLLDQLRDRVDKALLKEEGHRVQVTISIGAALRGEGEDLQQAMKRADEALYAAKGAGGNAVAVHDGSAPQLHGCEI